MFGSGANLDGVAMSERFWGVPRDFEEPDGLLFEYNFLSHSILHEINPNNKLVIWSRTAPFHRCFLDSKPWYCCSIICVILTDLAMGPTKRPSAPMLGPCTHPFYPRHALSCDWATHMHNFNHSTNMMLAICILVGNPLATIPVLFGCSMELMSATSIFVQP